jgi:hypothetical protein
MTRQVRALGTSKALVTPDRRGLPGLAGTFVPWRLLCDHRRVYLAVVVPVLVAGCGRVHFETIDGGGAPAADAVAADGSELVVACDGPRADTVALYTFEAGPGLDATGQHHGQLRGGLTTVPSPCGVGLFLQDGAYVLVPHAPGFDLATGSIELLAMVPTLPPAGRQALLARDAKNQSRDGHLSLGLLPDGGLLLRMQTMSITVTRCTEPVPAGAWFHVGASFGGDAGQGLRLWLDHVETTRTSAFDVSTIDCTIAHPFGIDGNDNALVIGGTNAEADEGDPDPAIEAPFTGAIDHVRISSSWIDHTR